MQQSFIELLFHNEDIFKIMGKNLFNFQYLDASFNNSSSDRKESQINKWSFGRILTLKLCVTETLNPHE